MSRHWRAWILLLLLVGPILVYVVFGAVWLAQWRGPIGFRGEWLTYAGAAWVASGVAFSVLASRWTKARRPLLPPLNWNAPGTFAAADREAWEIVQEAAARGDDLDHAALARFDTYIDTGRGLAQRLAAHYHPDAADPIETVPVVELLTAFQLAAEDLGGLCRQVPGGDLVTPGHWKKAVAAADYVSRANELYTLLLPVFQPVAGLARLGAQKLVSQPAWKDARQNLMRWFFRAYVNRLGAHLVELYSGRLALGAEQYRRLVRAGQRPVLNGELVGPMTIAVAGASRSGKSAVLAALEKARTADLEIVRSRLTQMGLDESLADRLRQAKLIEVPSYPNVAPLSNSRERKALMGAVARAAEADLLVLAVDADRDDPRPDAAFVEAWLASWARDDGREPPPALAVLTNVDSPRLADDAWRPPYQWLDGQRPREIAVRARANRLRDALPAGVVDVVPLGLIESAPFGVNERLLPEIATLLARVERSAILREMRRFADRSKVGRLVRQIGRQGRKLWSGGRSSGPQG